MNIDRKTLLKMFFLVILVVAAGVGSYLLGLQQFLDKEFLQRFFAQFGVFSALAYVVIFSLAVALVVPATPFTIVGAVIFGPWWGTLLNIIAVTFGSTVAFIVARSLGRDFARKVAGKTLEKYDEKLQNHGFATIFYLRLILLPLAPVNYGAGLTRVSLKDFILGTAFGVIPATFIIMFFVSKLTDVTTWTDLLTWDTVLACALFIGSFFIPKLVRIFFKKEHLLEK